MGAVTKREFGSYMHSVYGILWVSVMLLLIGVFFFLYDLMFADPEVEMFLPDFSAVLTVAIPLLAARIMNSDKKNGADRFLFSLPLKTSEIVMGKYLAMLAVLAIPTVLLCILPLLLSLSGEVALLKSYTSILGFFLLSCALTAISACVSSLAKNQIIAVLTGIAVTLVLFLMNALGEYMPKPISCLSPFCGLESFANGIFDLSRIVYYLSVTAFFLLLTVCSLDKKRRA